MSEIVSLDDLAMQEAVDIAGAMDRLQIAAYATFTLAARNLKAIQDDRAAYRSDEFRAAQQAYAEAVKRLSEAAAP